MLATFALAMTLAQLFPSGEQRGLDLELVRSHTLPPTDARPILSTRGRSMGWIHSQGKELRIEPNSGVPFDIPAFQDVRASADGSTLVAWGDPTAPEHPFDQVLRVYREGRLALRIDEPFSLGSSLTVAADGRFAIAGMRNFDRSQWEVVWSGEEDRLERQLLPPGKQARDPVFFGNGLLLRVHGLRREGQDGSILHVDHTGVRTLLETPAALQLVGFPEQDRALVRSRRDITLIDSKGSVLWSRALVLRPVGLHAWTWWPEQNALAVLVSDVQRAGATIPPVRLVVLSASDGRLQAETVVTRRTPLTQARLAAEKGQLAIEWGQAREIYGPTPETKAK